MNNEERARFEQEFPVPRNVWWNPEWCGEGRYEWVNVLLQDDSPEKRSHTAATLDWLAGCGQIVINSGA